MPQISSSSARRLFPWPGYTPTIIDTHTASFLRGPGSYQRKAHALVAIIFPVTRPQSRRPVSNMKFLNTIATIFLLLVTLTAATDTVTVLSNSTGMANGTELTTGSGGGKSFLIYSVRSGSLVHREMDIQVKMLTPVVTQLLISSLHWLFTEGTGDDFYGCKELLKIGGTAHTYINWNDCSSESAVCCDGPGCMWSGTGCPWDGPDKRDSCDFKYHDATKINRLEMHTSWGHYSELYWSFLALCRSL
jgi:hypothetical protein